MKSAYLEEEEEKLNFVKMAAKAFEKDAKLNTFTEGEIKSGVYFAVRWGLGDNCVLCLRLSDKEEPTVYG